MAAEDLRAFRRMLTDPEGYRIEKLVDSLIGGMPCYQQATGRVGDSTAPGRSQDNDPGEFLSADELHQLTGKVRPTAQARWLSANGYRFERTGDSKIVVSRDEAKRHLVKPTRKPRGGEDKPDLSKVR